MSAIGERYVRARKPHTCERCRHKIMPGEVYVQSKTTPSHEFWPGHWNTWRTHDGWCPDEEPLAPSTPNKEQQ